MKKLFCIFILLLGIEASESTFAMFDDFQLIDSLGRISPEDDDFKSCEEDHVNVGEVDVCPYEDLLLHIKTLETLTFFIALQCDLNSAEIKKQDNFIDVFGQPFLYDVLEGIDMLDGDLYELSDRPLLSPFIFIGKMYIILKRIIELCGIKIDQISDIINLTDLLSHQSDIPNASIATGETWIFFNEVKSILLACLEHAHNYPNSFAQEAGTLRRESICFNTIIPLEIERSNFEYFEQEEFKNMFDFIKQAAGKLNSDALFQASLVRYTNNYRQARRIFYEQNKQLQPGIDAMLQRCAVISTEIANLKQEALDVESDVE
ncbi:hypothetical protein JST56_02180 [Candidatus Dependentiae bacterium]|nr:hypothetical protein [Candidatus Dependentiae bacterium]